MPSIAVLKRNFLQKKASPKKEDLTLVLQQLGASSLRDVVKSEVQTTTEKELQDIVSKVVDKVLDSQWFVNLIIRGVQASVRVPKDGENYILTEEDKKEIASTIIPSERVVVEKTIIKEKPTTTEIVKEFKIENPVTGKEVVDKINELPIKPEFQIDAKHIKNLPEKDSREGVKLGSGIARGGLKLVWNTELNGTIDDSNTIFTLPTSAPTPIDGKFVISARGALKDSDSGDFTVSNNNRTITFTDAPPTGSGRPRIVVYQAH